MISTYRSYQGSELENLNTFSFLRKKWTDQICEFVNIQIMLLEQVCLPWLSPEFQVSNHFDEEKETVK